MMEKQSIKKMITIAAALVVVTSQINAHAKSISEVPVFDREIKSITIDEFELISKTVMAESGGEDYDTQYACAETILNRIDSDDFPNTVEGVLFQKNQFSVWSNGAAEKAIPTDSVYEAVQYAIEERTFPTDVVYFTSNGYPEWGEPYMESGNMYFARDKPFETDKQQTTENGNIHFARDRP